MRRAATVAAVTVAVGAAVGWAAAVGEWSDTARYVVTAAIAAVLVVLGLPYALLRGRKHDMDDELWSTRPERVPSLGPRQGFSFGHGMGEISPEQERWQGYWWARVPVRTDDAARLDRLLELSPITLADPRYEQHLIGPGRPYPVRIDFKLLGHEPSEPTDALHPAPTATAQR